MEPFKIEHLERETGKGSFPSFKSLTSDECLQYRQKFALALGLEAEADSLVILKSIFCLEAVRTVHIEDGKFDLATELALVCPDPESSIFINWYQFDDIDQMKLVDLSVYFDDIWYPSVDDIEIFDSALTWVATVSHYYVFRLIHLGGKGKS